MINNTYDNFGLNKSTKIKDMINKFNNNKKK